jgi:hypothetical protein
VKAVKAFVDLYGAKWPEAVAKVTADLDVLLAFYRLPGRALDPSADHEPDRVDLRHRAAAAAGHQGTRLTRCRHRGIASRDLV